MLLRASGQLNDEDVNLQGMVAEAEMDTGVASGDRLIGFADAVLEREASNITQKREELERELGRGATVDAAAIVANFQRMVRIADGTGIPLDEPVLMMTQGIREELNINSYNAAANSPDLPLLKKLLGRALGPFGPKLLARISRRRMAQH